MFTHYLKALANPPAWSTVLCCRYTMGPWYNGKQKIITDKQTTWGSKQCMSLATVLEQPLIWIREWFLDPGHAAWIPWDPGITGFQAEEKLQKTTHSTGSKQCSLWKLRHSQIISLGILICAVWYHGTLVLQVFTWQQAEKELQINRPPRLGVNAVYVFGNCKDWH